MKPYSRYFEFQGGSCRGKLFEVYIDTKTGKPKRLEISILLSSLEYFNANRSDTSVVENYRYNDELDCFTYSPTDTVSAI